MISISPRENGFSLVFKDLASYMSFGGGGGVAPAGLNWDGGFGSLHASGEQF